MSVGLVQRRPLLEEIWPQRIKDLQLTLHPIIKQLILGRLYLASGSRDGTGIRLVPCCPQSLMGSPQSLEVVVHCGPICRKNALEGGYLLRSQAEFLLDLVPTELLECG